MSVLHWAGGAYNRGLSPCGQKSWEGTEDATAVTCQQPECATGAATAIEARRLRAVARMKHQIDLIAGVLRIEVAELVDHARAREVAERLYRRNLRVNRGMDKDALLAAEGAK